jgi:DNA-binding MurR/RpiR family transcriptional regulator
MIPYQARIRSIRDSLSPSYTRLADYLLDEYAHAALQTATELAHTLDIDPATVVRFAQKLNYPGYPELQREIRERVRHELLDPPSPDNGTSAAEQTLADLSHFLELSRKIFAVDVAERLVAAFDEAERILVLSEGLGRGAAHALAHWLEAAGYTIGLVGGEVSDMASAVSGCRRGDLVVVIEVVAETGLVARALAEARSLGARTAAIVASPSSPAARHADDVLSAYAAPDAALGMLQVEALVCALIRLLTEQRPGRHSAVQRRVDEMIVRLAGNGSRHT